MNEDHLSRRGFFRRAAAAPAAAAGAVTGATRPPKGWVILELGWETNDEFSFVEGEHLHFKLYLSREEAEAKCRRLCEAFFAAESPQEFRADFEFYGCDPETATWDDLRAAGFPDPYCVQELDT